MNKTALATRLLPTSAFENLVSLGARCLPLALALLVLDQKAQAIPPNPGYPPVPTGTVSETYTFEAYPADAFVTQDTNQSNSGWTTNDQWLNNGIIVGTPTGKAGWIGGIYGVPTVPIASLKLAFDPKDNTKFTFQWVSNIANNANPDGRYDTFGMTVYSTLNNPLVTLKFDYGSFNYENVAYDTSVDVIRGGMNGAPISLVNLGLLNRGEYNSYKIEVDTWANTVQAGFAAGSNPSSVSYNLVGNSDNLLDPSRAPWTEDNLRVGGIGLVWDLSDKTQVGTQTLDDGTVVPAFNGAGNNIMTVDNLSVQGVPEPSSLSLLGLGGLALLSLQRRRQNR